MGLSQNAKGPTFSNPKSSDREKAERGGKSDPYKHWVLNEQLKQIQVIRDKRKI